MKYGLIWGGYMAFCLTGLGLSACADAKADDSCPKALDAAEVVISKASSALTAASGAINSFLAGDLQGINDENAKLDELTRTVDGDMANYQRLAAECRSGS